MNNDLLRRKTTSILMVFIMLLSFFAVPPQNVSAAEKIKLTKTSGSVVIGGKTNIKLKNVPENSTITYKSKKPSIAAVSNKGKVTGKKAGTTKITVNIKSKQQNKKLTYKITVKKPALSARQLSLETGKEYTLSIQNKPTGKTKAKYTWTSSNEKVAVVKNGKILAQNPGSVTISVKIKVGKNYKATLKCKLVVSSSASTATTQTPAANTPLPAKSTTQASTSARTVVSPATTSSVIAPATENASGIVTEKSTEANSKSTTETKTDRTTAEHAPSTIEVGVDRTTEAQASGTTEVAVGRTTEARVSGTTEVTVDKGTEAQAPHTTERSGGGADEKYDVSTRETEAPVTTENIAVSTELQVQQATEEFGETHPSDSQTEYLVSFVSNGGGAVAAQKVTEGSPAVKPEMPTRDGYVFVSWFTDPELTTEFDFSKGVKKDITLYAKWTDDSATASYTRGQWIQRLAEMIHMNLDADADQIDNYYSDTDGSPYEIAIETAYAYGLLPETVLEDPEQDVPCFKPDGKATREFVAYTSVAAAGFEEENEPDHTGWMDWESIAYKNAAFLSVKFDFLRLEDGFFHPADAIDDVDIALISNRFEQLENSVELTQDEIHDDSIVLDTVIKDELTDVTDYTITETSEHTYTVSLPKRSNTEKLASGDVIMLPPNSEYIAGFSVKITDANTAGDQVILTGIAPEIEEVYSKIDFAGYATLMTDKIEAAEGVSVEYDPYGKIDDTDNNEEEQLNSKLKHIDGQATIKVPGKLKFKLSDKIKKSDKLKLTGSVEIEIPEISCIADLDIGLKDGFKANEFTFSLKNAVICTLGR